HRAVGDRRSVDSRLASARDGALWTGLESRVRRGDRGCHHSPPHLQVDCAPPSVAYPTLFREQPCRAGKPCAQHGQRRDSKMKKAVFGALLVLGTAAFASPAVAQQASITQTITGTRLDLTATGEVSRVPDIAIISAGVVSRSATASAALQDAANRMDKVVAALKRAGVADRDIQTSNVNLNPEYRYPENQSPQLVGYTATNTLTIRFRDIRSSGKILDALVAEGANQINGPNLTIDKPEPALDEARANAVAIGRARAEAYARSLGLRVVRVVSVSESGGYAVPPAPPPMPMMMARGERDSSTAIAPGEQKLQVSLGMTFELQ